MATRSKRNKVTHSPKPTRAFAFQAYVDLKENQTAIREAAKRREMSVSQFLVYSALKEAAAQKPEPYIQHEIEEGRQSA